MLLVCFVIVTLMIGVLYIGNLLTDVSQLNYLNGYSNPTQTIKEYIQEGKNLKNAFITLGIITTSLSVVYGIAAEATKFGGK